MRAGYREYEENGRCEREAKRYARALRLRRERQRKCLAGAASALAALGLILICSMSYQGIRSNASDGFKYYTDVTVGVGESLWEISEHYYDESHYADRADYISEVCSINHLEDADDITAGQTLIVPYYSSEYFR